MSGLGSHAATPDRVRLRLVISIVSAEVMSRRLIFLLLVPTVFVASVQANPIPVPVPASMPLEEMAISIDSDGHVTFTGDFTFDFIPDGVCPGLPSCVEVTKMQFPLPPVNPSDVAAFQDGVPLAIASATELYPTVLPEFPLLPMFEWPGPFPLNGAVFSVEYEHDVFERGDDLVFFYSLGTGKFFPTYDKITTALLDINLPHGAELVEILLDDTPLDPSYYTLNGNQLDVTLTSAFGPFTQDLIVVYNAPAPGSIGLFILGLAYLVRKTPRG